jgi:hypothetical protein
LKKIAAVFLSLVLLTGCTGKRDELDRAMKLRANLLGCLGCSFDVTVTADYGDSYYTFVMNCQATGRGDLQFTVLQPESIAGITGEISSGEGKLTFDDVALHFPLLADDQVTPVSGPWILMKTLLGGYLTAANEEDDLLHLTIHDSYEEDALQMEIWLDGEDEPVNAEILYDGRRIVTMTVENFTMR